MHALLTPWRGLLFAAGLILSGTAILHGSAIPVLRNTLRATELAQSWSSALEGLWVMFAVEIAILAGFTLAVAVRPRLASDSALLIVAFLLASDTALLAGYVGLFPGTILVGVATTLVIVARVIRKPSQPETTG